MSLMKMPLLVWILLVDFILVLFALPPLAAAQCLLLFDRTLGAHFFDTQAGGSALLWQNLFWFFGHPEVYILILPAFAFTSEIVPVFSRKVIFGYPLMVAASMAICFISLTVWAHHLFAVGMSPIVNAIFMGSTMLVAVPTGIKMFNWTATMIGGKIRFHTPMLFSIGFLCQFLLGGLTGIFVATVPFDWAVSDSYFLVGHFHYVLFGGLLFAIFSGIYYWFPKVTGRMLSETLGKWHFWLLIIGFNLTFGPMHVSGLLGMPRRIYTYHEERGWELWNLLSSIGVLVQVVAIAFFVLNVLYSLFKGRKAGDDPWDAWTLEWSTTSPPPACNFEEIPVVHSRRPLWDLKHPDDPDWKYE
jgi:cytochrome c oxidase subunit 1